jgi:nicotinic acid mononucleotide adenylyltransferase
MYISPDQLRAMGKVQALLDCLRPEATAEAVCVPATKAPRGNVIIFTGSFNPPTNAHLALLKQGHLYARSHTNMHVYGAFTRHTVDKETVERPLLLDRIMLMQKVLRRRLPDVGLLLFNRGLYVEQAEALRNSFPHVHRILFLMGFDKIVQIFDPRYYADRDAALEALFNLAELLVVPRGSGGYAEIQELLKRPENKRFARYVQIHPFAQLYRDVSATRVREGGLKYEHDVPREVRHFMHDSHAYAPPTRLADGREVDYYGERVAYLRSKLEHVL